MKIVIREDMGTITIVINEFIVGNKVDSKECIPTEFLKYLRKANMKIEDGVLFNELCDLIEKKLNNTFLCLKRWQKPITLRYQQRIST